MPRVLAVLILVAIIVYALVDASQASPGRVRLMPRWLWIVAIVLLPGIGALGWFALGRPRGQGPSEGGPRRTIAPDDDPDFLRRL
ncbi:MAG: PLD nuclease N-terminal domain-containing protein [Propioniciclava sp.]|uniref:PLD nuclease N-terminal domain-containing protein n=1 Tax=Propioniciclava sp. TaxID=2038686 RepID=UPI0039E5F6CC